MNKKENTENSTKTNINWFPGHMTKAKREMQEKLKQVDMVIELRDARIPLSSKNPLLDEIIGEKPRLIILTKKDKADDKETKAWIARLKNEHTLVLAQDTLHDNINMSIVGASKELLKANIERQIRRGIRPRALRAMVVGIPNVGKSTLINQIAKKNIAKAANKPGVTRSLQWVKVSDELELLDTPGVLWPKFEDEKVGVLLAVTGAIKDEILPLDEIAIYALEYLVKYHPDRLEKVYQIKIQDNIYQIFDDICEKRKFYLNNKEFDYHRAVDAFLKDLRSDVFGGVTWESADEYNQ